jgi:NDP-sugar pyrophosphorylase family protein
LTQIEKNFLKKGVTRVKKPILVIMAAGMGSRFGGLKQIEPVDEQGHIIMDFSIYDGRRAGFEKVIFIIKEENESLFRECIGDRIGKYIEVEYVFQDLTDLPLGYQVPEGREKPFGTGHAVLCCQDKIDGPFVVLNADDYYGVAGYQLIYDYLQETSDVIDGQGNKVYSYGMVGYRLEKTLTENGSVSRGVCQLDDEDYLTGITERTQIERQGSQIGRDGSQIAFTEDKGETWIEIGSNTIVSMNLFGFTHSFMDELRERFKVFLDKELPLNPMKGEFFLPSVVGELIDEDKANVKVLKSPDRWYGITYQEDKEGVEQAIKKMKEEGLYPEKLWD